MTEESAEYYNEVYKRPGTVYKQAYEKGRPAFRYIEQTQQVILSTGSNAIVEIGCGMGHMLATVLHETPDLKTYIGLDFSEVGIGTCQQIYDFMNVKLPRFELHRTDLNTIAQLPEVAANERNIYICHETLEHFEKDRECLALIPQGATVCISVPDFGGKGHVRHGNEAYWTDRYRHLLTYGKVTATGSPNKQHIWMVAKRR
jgi:ubiquinone/menaquinone biosynthesis C-methylase UbiE